MVNMFNFTEFHNECPVPENIHTSLTEGIIREFHGGGGFWKTKQLKMYED